MDSVIIDGLSFALPLFIIAIAGIYSERSGVTNLALEGLQGFGAFIGALVVTLLTLKVPADTPYLPYIAILFAMLGGMLYSMLHALLCVKFKANQVISGVVINILAMALTTFLTGQLNTMIFNRPSDKFVLSVFPRVTIPYLSKIPVLGAFFKDGYIFGFLILAVAGIAYYVLYKTKYGLRLRACGENPSAIDACGVSVAKMQFTAVMVSGALSGLGGMCFAYSISANFSPAIYVGSGYLAIAALIFGNWKIMPTFLACLLFGFARSGGYKISQMLKMPSSFSDLIMILPYVLTLLLLIFFSKTNRPPAALGEIYDKGKR